MSQDDLYAAPRDVRDLADCYFYHVMDLPGHGQVGGQWDLRGGEDAYLGGADVRGKRVLELGTASGFLCRHMEARGADVVGFDLGADASWDFVPFAGIDLAAFRDYMRQAIERMKNGWWFAHRLLGSRARAVYGHIYRIPEGIGPVDVSTFGAILLHLRDPFHALYNAARLTTERMIVTEVHPEQPPGSPLGVLAPPGSSPAHPGSVYFQPSPEVTDPKAAATWWLFPPPAVCRFLGVLGFEDHTVTEHTQLYLGKPARMYTVVANRTKPR